MSGVARPHHDGAEVRFADQPPLRVDEELEVGRVRGRRGAECAGGHLHVLFADGLDHVARRQVARRHLVGVQPHAHGIIAGAEDLHAVGIAGDAAAGHHDDPVGHGDEEGVAQVPGGFQVGDVAHMQQIEATVGEDYPLAVGPPESHAADQFGAGDHFVCRMKTELRGQRGKQFVLLHWHCANLAHYNPGGHIGQLHTGLRIEAACQAQRENCDDRVSGAGNVQDLAGHGRSHEAISWPQQRNALFTEGCDEEGEIEGRYHGFGSGKQALKVGCIHVQGQREFAQIGTYGRGASIAGKVRVLGVRQYRNIVPATGLNNLLADFRRERALGVV